MVYWPLWTVTFVVCHRGNELQSMSPSCTCSLVAAKNVLGKAHQMPTEGWLVQSSSLKEWHQARARAPVVRLRRKRGERYYQYHKLSQSHHESPDAESWHNRAVHSQRVSSKACKARYQHVRMGIPAGDSLDFIDSRKHVPFFMHFWELNMYT